MMIYSSEFNFFVDYLCQPLNLSATASQVFIGCSFITGYMMSRAGGARARLDLPKPERPIWTSAWLSNLSHMFCKFYSSVEYKLKNQSPEI
jgi:hypothetical protein